VLVIIDTQKEEIKRIGVQPRGNNLQDLVSKILSTKKGLVE
jgi:hypothetical protein